MFTESTSNLRGTTYKITVGPESGSSYLSEGFNSKTDVLIAEDEINTILYSITSNLSNNIEVKIKQVHNYLIDSIEYDSTSDSDTLHSIYGALIQKRAVCDGYAKSFKFILDNLGISCVEVCGTATNSSGVTESHAWNDILLNGKWYAVDVTWDDPIILGGNDNEVLTNELRYNYYLKGSDVFYLSHYEDGYIVSNGKFDYPTLEESNY
jgi:transglutaminase/protease-like cytokinesis protein 3